MNRLAGKTTRRISLLYHFHNWWDNSLYIYNTLNNCKGSYWYFTARVYHFLHKMMQCTLKHINKTKRNAYFPSFRICSYDDPNATKWKQNIINTQSNTHSKNKLDVILHDLLSFLLGIESFRKRVEKPNQIARESKTMAM